MRDFLLFGLPLAVALLFVAVSAAAMLVTSGPLEDDDDDDDDTEYVYGGEGQVDPAFYDRYDAEDGGFVQPVLEEEPAYMSVPVNLTDWITGRGEFARGWDPVVEKAREVGRRMARSREESWLWFVAGWLISTVVLKALGVAVLIAVFASSGCSFTIQEGAFDVECNCQSDGASCCTRECECPACVDERPIILSPPACPTGPRQGQVQGQAPLVPHPCPPVPLRRPGPSSRSSSCQQRAAQQPEEDLSTYLSSNARGDLRPVAVGSLRPRRGRYCRTTATLSRNTDGGRRADPSRANDGVVRVPADRSTPAIT